MRILLTSADLNLRGGAQLFASDLARKLLQWGHEPIAHSPRLGTVSEEMQKRTIAVTSDLRTMTVPPDIIIANYHLGAMTALHRFPGTPAIFVCHGPGALVAKAPRIRRYVAVDESCRAHLLYECGIDERSVELILTAVDLSRFTARTSLPAKPGRALLFGNEFAGDGPWRAIQTACREEGISLDIAGLGAGRSEAEPETLLPKYDLVFARARSALEAMASGAAVILAGPEHMATMVTAENVDRYRPLNFGRRALMTPIDAASVRREIARYDAAGAGAVCRTIRETASLDLAAAQFVRLAEEVIEEHRAAPVELATEYAATAQYLAELETHQALLRVQRLRERVERLPLIGGLAVRIARRFTR